MITVRPRRSPKMAVQSSKMAAQKFNYQLNKQNVNVTSKGSEVRYDINHF
jgi:hypothetical protein